ncbi:MAG: hypothetical protein ACYC96_11320 [Fimbriimonadaceae bacterium]
MRSGKSKADAPTPPSVSVAAGSGSMSIRVEPANRLAYTVRWKAALVTASDPVHLEGVGSLKGVSGTLYRAGSAAANFSADEGAADKALGILSLSGNVKVTAVSGKRLLNGTTVRCDRVNYATADEIIKATGHVTIMNSTYTLGPIAEAWCANNLSEVASPGDFVGVRHNQPATAHP